MMEVTLEGSECRDLQDLQGPRASWDLRVRKETVEVWVLKETTDCLECRETWVPWVYQVPWDSRDLRGSWDSPGPRDLSV